MPSVNIAAAKKRLDDLLAPYDRADAPGYVVGVRYGEALLYRRGLGMASIEHGRSNTPATRMRIASTTKQFVCLAALMMQDEGLLDIDRPVGTYLDELDGVNARPTLRQLMNHTGGLRCYVDLSFIAQGLAPLPAGERLALQARQSTANFPPGERMVYCNGGYMLLSHVLERVSGQALQSLMVERIFDPLGMSHTEMVPSDLDLTPGLATCHVRCPDGSLRRGLFPQHISGDGALVSTVDDMLRWLANLRHPVIGHREILDQMFACPTLTSGLTTKYSLGLQQTNYRGVRTIHHAGGVIGGSCQALTVPEHDLDVVILGNGANISSRRLAPLVVDAVLGEVLAAHERKVRTIEFPQLNDSTYQSPSGLLVSFADQDGVLAASVYGGDPVALQKKGRALGFDFDDAAVGPIDIEIPPPRHGTPRSLVVSECGHAQTCLLQQPLNPEQRRDLLGELDGLYACADLNATAHVDANEGPFASLYLRGPFGSNRLDLTPVSRQALTWRPHDPAVTAAGSIQLERDAGRLVAFHVNSNDTRRLRFTRTSGRSSRSTIEDIHEQEEHGR